MGSIVLFFEDPDFFCFEESPFVLPDFFFSFLLLEFSFRDVVGFRFCLCPKLALFFFFFLGGSSDSSSSPVSDSSSSPRSVSSSALDSSSSVLGSSSSSSVTSTSSPSTPYTQDMTPAK